MMTKKKEGETITSKSTMNPQPRGSLKDVKIAELKGGKEERKTIDYVADLEKEIFEID